MFFGSAMAFGTKGIWRLSGREGIHANFFISGSYGIVNQLLRCAFPAAQCER
jgi:hypothetical protein